jgi:23S rRNA pseudouridine955/2504/2580 synthase
MKSERLNFFNITESFEGMRLDRYCGEELNLPHSLITKLVRKKDIRLNGKKTDIGAKLKKEDVLSFPAFLNVTPKEYARGKIFISEKNLQKFKEIIKYECETFFIIDKPSGLSTQGGSGITYSVDEYIFHLNPEFRLVHRLDKETSGAMIIAKSRSAASEISKDFREKLIKKHYIAITRGIPDKHEGIIELKLKKNNFSDYGGIVTPDEENGKDSLTYFKVLETGKEFAKLELTLETGRMHQIRAHLQSIDCAIVGDTKYGDFTSPLAKSIMPKMLLHAHSLSYKAVNIIIPLPPYFENWNL